MLDIYEIVVIIEKIRRIEERKRIGKWNSKNRGVDSWDKK